MANHRAAALLLIASVLAASALSGADARLTVRPNVAAALRAANGRFAVRPGTKVTLRRDAHGGYVVDVAAAPDLTCNTVRGVQADETCFSVAQGAGLTQDQFLGFNPNINCAKIFVGQWVCLDATTSA